MTSFTNAIKEGKVDIVPKTLINSNGSENGGTTNAFESLIMLLLREKLTSHESAINNEENGDIKRSRDEILAQLSMRDPEVKK